MSTREVIAFAKRQQGVFTSKEAQDLGMSRSTLSRRVKDGVFVRLTRGVMALPGTATRPDALMLAAGRTLGAVVSHTSAAAMHRMGPIKSGLPTVTVPYRRTHSFPGLRVYQSTDLQPGHVIQLGEHDVTSPERTVVDLARVVGRRRLATIMDNALSAETVQYESLVELYEALTRQGKPGMAVLGSLLEERSNEAIPATVLERALMSLIASANLPLPAREHQPAWLSPVDGRVDFAYVDLQIGIEADSRRWHRDMTAFENDRRRDNAAQLKGWIVLRITWRMIQEDPAYVVALVRSALETRSAGFSS